MFPTPQPPPPGYRPSSSDTELWNEEIAYVTVITNGIDLDFLLPDQVTIIAPHEVHVLRDQFGTRFACLTIGED